MTETYTSHKKKSKKNVKKRQRSKRSKTTTIQNINNIKIHVGDKSRKTKSRQSRTKPPIRSKPSSGTGFHQGGGGGVVGNVSHHGNVSHRSMETEHATNLMNNVYDVRNRAMQNQYRLESLYSNIGTLQNRIDGIGTQVLQRQQQPLMIDNVEMNDRMIRMEQAQQAGHETLMNNMDTIHRN